MEGSKEIISLQVLKNQSYDDSINTSGLDPNICSWNQKLYPELRSPNYSEKLNPIEPRTSTTSCLKPYKFPYVEKEPYNLSITPIISHSPIPIGGLRRKFKPNKSIMHTKNANTPEPHLFNNRKESPNILKNSNYLNNLTLKKFKLKTLPKMKPADKNLMNISMPRHIEFFSMIQSPYIQNMNSPIFSNKLPLSTAKTLEELLRNTKILKINKKCLKYKNRQDSNKTIK